MREPEEMGWYAVTVADGTERAMHAVMSRAPEHARPISEQEARAISAALRVARGDDPAPSAPAPADPEPIAVDTDKPAPPVSVAAHVSAARQVRALTLHLPIVADITRVRAEVYPDVYVEAGADLTGHTAHLVVIDEDGDEIAIKSKFAGTIEDGRLYGWGVADDLAGVAEGT